MTPCNIVEITLYFGMHFIKPEDGIENITRNFVPFLQY